MNRNELDVEQINDVFYVIRQHKGGNIGVCIRDHAALILDSGYLPRRSALLTQMVQEDLGCRIELLFNTHYHADHTFGNQSFDCDILSTTKCKNTMRECLSTHWAPDEIEKAKLEDPELVDGWKDLRITLPTTTFDRRKECVFHGIRILFLEVGGHTAGSAVAVLPDYRLLFSGDLVFGELYPTLLVDGDPYALVDVLSDVTKMEIDTIAPGHGVTCGKDFVERLTDYWRCLTSQSETLAAAGKSDGEIRETLISSCRLRGVPYNDARHVRNVSNVLEIIRQGGTGT